MYFAQSTMCSKVANATKWLSQVKWETVYFYFNIWAKKPEDNEDSIIEIVLKKLVGLVRIENSRNATTNFSMVAAQSVKNTDTAWTKGYDVGKKISGIKRHIAANTQGLPHAIPYYNYKCNWPCWSKVMEKLREISKL